MFILANVIQEAFSPLISVFQWILVFIHTNITTTSWGLAIVGLTVLIRAVLVPLTLKQFRSMQELQRLAPELKALQEKYKDDKQRHSRRSSASTRSTKSIRLPPACRCCCSSQCSSRCSTCCEQT